MARTKDKSRPYEVEGGGLVATSAQFGDFYDYGIAHKDESEDDKSVSKTVQEFKHMHPFCECALRLSKIIIKYDPSHYKFYELHTQSPYKETAQKCP